LNTLVIQQIQPPVKAKNKSCWSSHRMLGISSTFSTSLQPVMPLLNCILTWMWTEDMPFLNQVILQLDDITSMTDVILHHSPNMDMNYSAASFVW